MEKGDESEYKLGKAYVPESKHQLCFGKRKLKGLGRYGSKTIVLGFYAGKEIVKPNW